MAWCGHLRHVIIAFQVMIWSVSRYNVFSPNGAAVDGDGWLCLRLGFYLAGCEADIHAQLSNLRRRSYDQMRELRGAKRVGLVSRD